MGLKLLFCLLGSFAITIATAQGLTPEQEYLKQNAATWNGSFNNLDRVLDKEVLNNQLFLIGENHGIQYNAALQFDLLVYLHKKTGLRHLMLELGFLDQIYINRYLETGNENVLDSFFLMHPGTGFYNKSEAELFKKLYAYNQKLAPQQRIRIFSVDLEFAHRDAIAFLQREVFATLPEPDKKLFAAMQPYTDTAKLLIRKFEAAHAYFRQHEARFQQLLEHRFEDTRHLLENIHNRYEAASSSAEIRDSIWHRNFLYAQQRYGLQNEKIAAFAGNFHIQQQDDPGDPRFAAIARRLKSVRGIVSFKSVYNGGAAMIPNRGNQQDSASSKKMFVNAAITNGFPAGASKQWEMLKPFFNNNKAYLFNLNKKHSPFHQSDAFTLENESYRTTQIFQILILYNQSPAAEPYKE